MAYKLKQSGDYRKRRNYSMIKNSLELDDLLQIQKESYQWFVTEGVKEVLEDFSPVESFSGSLSLEFGEYVFDTPRYSIKECKDRQITYAAPLKVQTRLFNNETGEVKEQEIFLGDMPLMTDSGTFIINGAERVVVSQLVRSPSVYFSKEVDKNGKPVFASKVIPTRGTWLEKYTLGDLTNCDTTTLSAPLIMNVPLSVIKGISPKKISCSLTSPVSLLKSLV